MFILKVHCFCTPHRTTLPWFLTRRPVRLFSEVTRISHSVTHLVCIMFLPYSLSVISSDFAPVIYEEKMDRVYTVNTRVNYILDGSGIASPDILESMDVSEGVWKRKTRY